MTPTARRPRLVIAGGSGLIGRRLVAHAMSAYDVTVLTRRGSREHGPGVVVQPWRPDAARAGDEPEISKVTTALEGAAGLVNLAGSPLLGGRLDRAHLRRAIESRVDATTTLTTALQRARRPPPVMVQASAIGIYGSRADEVLTESSPSNSKTRLAVVCRAWAAAAAPSAARTRLCIARFGFVFEEDAPSWKRMVALVRLGLGGALGSGDQWLAWIDADDLVKAVLFLIHHEGASGPYNLVSPQPVRQRELARLMARRLRRRAPLGVPRFTLRLVLGHLADETILQSARVVPERLLQAGFEHRVPTTKDLMEKLLPMS